MVHRWKTTVIAWSALGAALLLACGQDGQGAAGTGGAVADMSGQPEPRISSRHAGDAHAYNRGGYLVLVTSEDLDMNPVSYPGEIVNGSPRQNLFPMKTTWVHYLPVGSPPQSPASWRETAVLEESSITWFMGLFNGPNYHLWGPDMAFRADESATYLFAPDLQRQDTATSRVGVWRGRGFTGPFTQHGHEGTGDDGLLRIGGYTQGPTGYVSDPNVLTVDDGRIPNRYFLWADGDYDTEGIACGGIAIGRLRDNMVDVDDAHEVRIQGLPQITDSNSGCYKRAANVRQAIAEGRPQFGVPEARPYIESPALYYLTKEKDGVNSGSMPYYLIFPVNFDNGFQSLAYARASDPMGEFVYQGTVLPPGNEWTTHGSIVKWGEDWILFYHEKDTNADGLGRDRMVHATCLTFDSSGNIKAGNGGNLPLDRSATSNGYGINCAKRYGVSFIVSTSADRKDRSGRVTSVAAGVTGTMPDGQTFTCLPGQTCGWTAGQGGNLGLRASCPTGKVSWTGCTYQQGHGCSVSNITHRKTVTLTCLP
jgi:hypothetical protein